MGYRSDWTIVINSPGRGKYIRQRIDELIAQQTNCLLEEMYNKPDTRFGDENFIEIGGVGWKVYDWDQVVADLHGLFSGDDDIDMAWARIGEDPNDTELHEAGSINLHIQRIISDVSVAPMTAKKCRCDLHQIMRGGGHDAGCPEK